MQIINSNPNFPFILRYIEQGKSRYRISKDLQMQKQTLNIICKKLERLGIIEITKTNKPKLLISQKYTSEIKHIILENEYYENQLYFITNNPKGKQILKDVLTLINKNKNVYYYNIFKEIDKQELSEISPTSLLILLPRLRIVNDNNHIYSLTKIGKKLLLIL